MGLDAEGSRTPPPPEHRRRNGMRQRDAGSHNRLEPRLKTLNDLERPTERLRSGDRSTWGNASQNPGGVVRSPQPQQRKAKL